MCAIWDFGDPKGNDQEGDKLKKDEVTLHVPAPPPISRPLNDEPAKFVWGWFGTGFGEKFWGRKKEEEFRRLPPPSANEIFI